MAHLTASRGAPALLASALLLGAASGAEAHAHLVGATPAPNGAVAAGAKAITLRFSEPLMARFSGFEVTGANGAKLAASPVAVDPKGRKAMSATLKAPLAAGAYKVNWRVVSADTHRMQGSYSFKVQ